MFQFLSVFFMCVLEQVHTLWTLSFSSCLFKASPPLIGRLAHAWAITTYNNRAAVLNQFIGANQLLDYANVWLYDVVWCHRVTELRRDDWRGVSGAVFSVGERSFSHLLNFKGIYMHKNL